MFLIQRVLLLLLRVDMAVRHRRLTLLLDTPSVNKRRRLHSCRRFRKRSRLLS